MVNHNIMRFDITMHNAFGMAEIQGLQTQLETDV